MNAVKNVGSTAVEELLHAREESKFEKLEDIFSRVNPRVFNRKAVESLIKAGAFDRFGDRGQLLHNVDTLLAFANRIQKEKAVGQMGLFGDETTGLGMEPRIVLEAFAGTINQQEQLKWERELLGLYLSQHPLNLYETYLGELTMPISELKPEMDNKTIVVGGAISEMREITTKNGQKMAFVKIADLLGEIEVILFPSVYQQTDGIWERDRVVLVRGKLNAKDRQTGELNGDLKVLADEAREITAAQAEAYQSTGKTMKLPGVGRKAAQAVAPKPSQTQSLQARLYIRLVDSSNESQLVSLKAVIDENGGETDVVLVLGPADKKQIIKLPGGVTPNEPVVSRLKELVGESNVALQ